MRKILSVFAVVALLLTFTVSVEAADLTDEKFVIVNDSATGSKFTLIPITLIIPGKSRIVSITCTPISTGSGVNYENIVAVYDSSSASALTEKIMEGEVERDDDNTAVLTWKRPLKIYNGCAIAQGALTVVCVEYEDIPQP